VENYLDSFAKAKTHLIYMNSIQNETTAILLALSYFAYKASYKFVTGDMNESQHLF